MFVIQRESFEERDWQPRTLNGASYCVCVYVCVYVRERERERKKEREGEREREREIERKKSGCTNPFFLSLKMQLIETLFQWSLEDQIYKQNDGGNEWQNYPKNRMSDRMRKVNDKIILKIEWVRVDWYIESINRRMRTVSDRVTLKIEDKWLMKGHSIIHSFTHSLIHSFTHSLIHSLIHSFIHSFTHSFIHSFTHSIIHSFTHSLIHSLIHSFIHSLIHSFTHSLIHSFIHSFTHSYLTGALSPASSPRSPRSPGRSENRIVSPRDTVQVVDDVRMQEARWVVSTEV